MSKIIIEEMSEKTWEAVRRIYNAGIATGNATFQTEAPDREVWDQSHRKNGPYLARCGNARKKKQSGRN